MKMSFRSNAGRTFLFLFGIEFQMFTSFIVIIIYSDGKMKLESCCIYCNVLNVS